MFKAYQTLCRISPAYSHEQIIKKCYFIQHNLINQVVVSLQHGKNGIFCISWSHKDSKRIATCSGDGFW